MITLNCIYVTLYFYKNTFNVSTVRIKIARSTIGYSEGEERNEGDRRGRRHAGEQGGRRERAGQGGEGEAAAVDANRQGQDGDAANGEMIRKTAKEKEKEKEKERATHDAATEGRRKRRKSRHRRSLSSSEEDDEEEAGRRTREPTQRQRR